jgi:pectinesterase
MSKTMLIRLLAIVVSTGFISGYDSAATGQPAKNQTAAVEQSAVKIPANYTFYLPGKKNAKSVKADLEANGFKTTDTCSDHFSFVNDKTTQGKLLKINTLDGKDDAFSLPLVGTETKITVIFKAKGAIMPDKPDKPTPYGILWALLQRGQYQSLLRHNASNQIKGSTGQTNLGAENIVTDWHDYRLVFDVAADAKTMTATAFIDGKQRHQTAGFVKEFGEGNFISFGESDGSTNGFGRYPYLLIIKNEDVSAKSLADLSKSVGFNLEAVPQNDDANPVSKRPKNKPAGINMTAADASSKDKSYKDPSAIINGVIDLSDLPFSKNFAQRVNAKPVLPADIAKKAAAVVDASGKGTHRTIKEAVESVKPGSIIYIKPGTYQEKIKITKADISLIGESPANTIIYGYETDTGNIEGNILVEVALDGGSFTAENITFYNKGAEWNKTWDNVERRTIAFATKNVHKAYIKNCIFLGQQDTLYLRSGRQYFENCYIEGDVDFICGGATVLFSDCHIHCLSWKEGGYIFAAAPSDTNNAGFNNGYVVRSSSVTADYKNSGKNIFIGRGAWNGGSGGGSNQAKVVVMTSQLHGNISDKGWADWDNVSTAAKQFFREYKNTGDGSAKMESATRIYLKSDEFDKNYSSTEKILGFTPKMPY